MRSARPRGPRFEAPSSQLSIRLVRNWSRTLQPSQLAPFVEVWGWINFAEGGTTGCFQYYCTTLPAQSSASMRSTFHRHGSLHLCSHRAVGFSAVRQHVRNLFALSSPTAVQGLGVVTLTSVKVHKRRHVGVIDSAKGLALLSLPRADGS